MAVLLTTSGAAERLGVSTKRVQAMIAAGRLAATRMGRDWMISEEALAAVKDRKPGRPAKPAEPEKKSGGKSKK